MRCVSLFLHTIVTSFHMCTCSQIQEKYVREFSPLSCTVLKDLSLTIRGTSRIMYIQPKNMKTSNWSFINKFREGFQIVIYSCRYIALKSE